MSWYEDVKSFCNNLRDCSWILFNLFVINIAQKCQTNGLKLLLMKLLWTVFREDWSMNACPPVQHQNVSSIMPTFKKRSLTNKWSEIWIKIHHFLSKIYVLKYCIPNLAILSTPQWLAQARYGYRKVSVSGSRGQVKRRFRGTLIGRYNQLYTAHVRSTYFKYARKVVHAVTICHMR